MEKSIETIWKEGFLNKDALIAPKINNLYNQKSTHVVAKFKRMFVINRYAIVIFSIAAFIGYAAMGVPYMGAIIAILSLIVAWVSKIQEKKLNHIEAGMNSYTYLKSFDQWLKEVIAKNTQVMRFFYPLIFLAASASVWLTFERADGINKLIEDGFDIYLINGYPVIWFGVVLSIAVLMTFFGGHIYRFDLNIVYGRMFKKLNTIIKDMEELQGQS